MGLNIRLLHGDQCVINGAVIKCKSQRTTISVENYAHVIRGPDILKGEDVNTPLRRVYFAAQLMLIDPAGADQHRRHFDSYAGEVLDVLENPEMLGQIHQAISCVDAKDYYKALVALKPVLEYEKQLLAG